MPRRPPAGPPDGRLDPYRERGAGLYNESGDRIGTMFLRVEQWSDVRGALFWKRFSNRREILHGYFLSTTGDFDDFLDDGLDDDQLNDWSRGHFRWRGKVARIDWADTNKSLQIRDRTFGLGPPAPDP